jgi:hypothetical protein
MSDKIPAYMEVSWNDGTPKLSIWTGFSIIKQQFLDIGYPHLWKPPYFKQDVRMSE